MSAAFRILDQSPTFLDANGKPLANGYLAFYLSGTDTPQDVYGDQALTINNGSQITLGADGRAVDDIWGSGSYRVRCYAQDGTLIWEKDDVEIPGGGGTAIPALVAGQFLSTDGSVLVWTPVREVPDPTGETGKLLSNDGTNLTWIAAPASVTLPDGGVAQDDSSITIGKQKIQLGSGTAPASGAHTTSVNVTFPTPYASAPKVFVTLKNSSVTSNGYNPIGVVTNLSATGFTLSIDINASSNQPGINIGINFDYMAVGLVS